MLHIYINQLLDRILDKSDQEMLPGYDSSKTISWKALREAEQLTDTRFIENIIDNIGIEKRKHRRRYLYFIVYRICEKNFYQKGLDFLIDSVDKESDKYIISSILDGIICLPKSSETNITKIFEAVHHKTWQVRFSAISALQNTNNLAVERLMIQLLQSDITTKHELSNAIAVLYNCGSLLCINALEKLLQNKSRNIKSEADGTIKVIKAKYKNG